MSRSGNQLDRILKLRLTISQIWSVVPVCPDRLALQMATHDLSEIEGRLSELESAIAKLEKHYLPESQSKKNL